MSENKCPCCGDTISIFTDSCFYECDSCPFMCTLEDFPRIAAAMKAEARHNALVEAVKKYRAACATPGVSYSSKAIAWAEVDRLLEGAER